jgi:hypothetical protein
VGPTQMHTKWRLAAWLIILDTPSALGAQPITRSNWQHHPAIAEIRAIYREIKQAEGARRLRKLQRQWADNCEAQPYEDTERVLYLEAGGAVRSYHFSGGSEDSVARRALYYDRDGRLRFVLIKAGAVNGTRLEHRIYLSKDGKRLWEMQTRLEGPGYTFPSHQWWEEDLVWSPKQAFDAKTQCEARH